MKTNDFCSRKFSIYGVFGLLALVLTSCGTTYQNKSYYDNDGVYVSETPKKTVDEDRKNNEKYQDYFAALNLENQDLFTEVENYKTNDSIENTTENQNRSYSGWGSNSTESVVINVYDNSWGWGGWNNWGWGGGWNNWGWGGWNNWGWGGGWNNWGWGGGWNNWGWGGWNNWGWGGWNNGFYGNHYAFVNGPRGGRNYFPAGPGRTATVNRDSRFNGSRNATNPRSFSTSNTRNNTSGTRATTPSGTRSNTSGTRTNTSSTRPQNSDGGTRTNTTRSNTTTRSYSDTPRSYSPSPSSSGGGRSGGYSGGGSSGGGGGRSGGGGGRR